MENIENIYRKDTDILVQPVAGDTDSVAANTVLETNIGRVSIEQLFNNCKGTTMMTSHGAEMKECGLSVKNWDDDLKFSKIKYVIRHRITKPKWRLRTKSGKIVEVTGDHSLIVFRNGQKLEVKPKDVLSTDKILVLV